ncbi:DNA repair protein RecO [candidate division KSB1 bacterium]|nr:DNA repair protein RecO [candidate division KSB1 bacterium]
MTIRKTAAIVLHSQKQGETSKILRIYTRQYGSISLMVKGARSIKGKQWGALETLSRVQLHFYHRETRHLHYARQVDIEDSFRQIRSNLGKFALAMIPCEIVLKAEEPEHANPRLYDLLNETLKALEEKQSGLRNIVRAFEWKYLELTGIKPRLDGCLGCGKTAIETSHCLVVEQGLLACPECAPPALSTLTLSGSALRYLRHLDQISLAQAGEIAISGSLGKEIDTVLVTFMRYHLDSLHHLHSLKVLESMQDALNGFDKESI